MKIFPAIDLRGGKAVRLFQGDYDQETVYSDSPVEVAKSFQAAGAKYLHLVDLDGAKDGELVNFDTVKEIAAAVDMYVEIGGGIRNEERIWQYLERGVDRVILGTIAIEDRHFLERMAQRYRGKLAVGVDAKDGKVATRGWKEVTDIDGFEFCEYLASIGIDHVIYTDISRDGAMKGTNIEAYRRLAEIDGLSVTASGGISSEAEIIELSGIVDSAILGKALYTGALDLSKCVELAGDQSAE